MSVEVRKSLILRGGQQLLDHIVYLLWHPSHGSHGLYVCVVDVKGDKKSISELGGLGASGECTPGHEIFHFFGCTCTFFGMSPSHRAQNADQV